jgi:hypothetical protein
MYTSLKQIVHPGIPEAGLHLEWIEEAYLHKPSIDYIQINTNAVRATDFNISSHESLPVVASIPNELDHIPSS